MSTKNNLLSRGFTIIELIVVIAIILILTTIATFNVLGTQSQARDVEREQDIKSISLHFENYYNELHFNVPYNPAPTYPATLDTDTLKGLNPEATRAPGVASGSSLTMATNTNETIAGVTPQPSVNQYVYQPFNESGNLCTSSNGPCIRYNFFWRSEVTNTIQKISSRNQQ